MGKQRKRRAVTRRRRNFTKNKRRFENPKPQGTAKDMFGIGPRNWAGLWVLGGFIAVGTLFPVSVILPMLTGQVDYDGREMLAPLAFLVLLTALACMLPHLFVSNDGSIPTFTDDRYSPALFWYLVAMASFCAILIALAPTLALLDGYNLSDYVRTLKSRSRHTGQGPLWLLAPVFWAGSAVLFFFIARGVWRRFTRPIPFRSYRGMRPSKSAIAHTNSATNTKTPHEPPRRRKAEKPFPWWVTALGIGIMLLAVFGFFAKAEKADTMTSTTDGWVTEVEERAARKSRSCSVEYWYVVNDQTHRVKTRWDGGCDAVDVFTWSTVYYDPAHPEHSQLQDPESWAERYAGGIILFIVGAGLAVYPVLLRLEEEGWSLRRWRSRRQAR